jgi:hypothetical protein
MMSDYCEGRSNVTPCCPIKPEAEAFHTHAALRLQRKAAAKKTECVTTQIVAQACGTTKTYTRYWWRPKIIAPPINRLVDVESWHSRLLVSDLGVRFRSLRSKRVAGVFIYRAHHESPTADPSRVRFEVGIVIN